MDFQLAFNKSKGIKVSNVIDHFVKSVTDDQYNALLDDDLILESCSIEDIENTLVIGIPCVPDMMLEAITTKAVSLKNTMRAFARSLNKETAPQGITVNFDKSGDAIEVSKPRKSGLVAVQTGKLTLSDGQSVSIVFHAPDNDPLKINPTDTLIAFRFLLNSRDVTHLVAPKGGKDVSLVQVTTALSQVIGKNSEKFKAAQSEKNSLKQEIDDSDRQALELEAELAQISGKADQIDADIVTTNGNIDTLQKRIDRENDIQAKLRAELDALTPPAATTTSDIPNAGGNGEPTPEPTTEPTTEPVSEDKFVKHSRSENGNVVYTRAIDGVTYYFAKCEYTVRGDSYTPTTSRKGWLWATRLDDNGDPDMYDTHYAESTREEAYKAVIRNIESRKRKLEHAQTVLLPEYQSVLSEYGNQFVDAYNSNDTEAMTKAAEGFNSKVMSFNRKGLPDSMMPVLRIRSDKNAERFIEQLAEQGITGSDVPNAGGKDFESMKGANTDKLDDYIDENFAFGTKRFRDLIDANAGKLEQSLQVDGVYALYREFVNSGMEQGYSITKSAGEKLFASYFDLDDEVRTISNAGMLAKPSNTGINFEAMLKGEVSKEQANKWLKVAQGFVDLDSRSEKITSENATGETNHWYGMRIRPFGIGNQPNGQTAYLEPEQAAAKFPDFDERSIRFGAIAYAEPLSKKDVEHYNLTDLQKVISPLADEDYARAAVEDAVSLYAKRTPLDENIIYNLVQKFKLATGDNRKRIQSVFAKELRQDFFFENRNTDKEGYMTWFESLNLIDEEMLTTALNEAMAKQKPAPVVEEPEVKTPSFIRDEKAIKSATNKLTRSLSKVSAIDDEIENAEQELDDNSHLIYNDYGDVKNKTLLAKIQRKVDAANKKNAVVSEKITSAYKEFRDAGGSNDEWDSIIEDSEFSGLIDLFASEIINEVLDYTPEWESSLPANSEPEMNVISDEVSNAVDALNDLLANGANLNSTDYMAKMEAAFIAIDGAGKVEEYNDLMMDVSKQLDSIIDAESKR
ncbi:defense against restriction DarA-related protein [Photobacterium leiognathi]|uniref:defense against restriction DarA-related protein n=1 Tax=Photobacterium leiognathi TaxID=553611 RepID=UPI0029820153|nr:hypothetical protein [Photobacterium leiognathi]